MHSHGNAGTSLLLRKELLFSRFRHFSQHLNTAALASFQYKGFSNTFLMKASYSNIKLYEYLYFFFPDALD